nr:RagB/SusD family nutrient uptake outer membrane protein [Pedobacter panaciterrae]
MGKNINFYSVQIILVSVIVFFTGCKKLVEVEGPSTSVNSANIYENDVTATSALTGIYTLLSASSVSSESLTGIGYYTGLSSDELQLLSGYGNPVINTYYTNSLDSRTPYDFWNRIYNQLYYVNAALEGIGHSNTLTPKVKQQLIGEGKFMRAFCFFYLVNLYGDVPLTLSTNYKVNIVLPRSQQPLVWKQIIEDLKDAEVLLNADFLDGSLLKTTNERVRPTKWAAKALLARAYLYTKDWKMAEEESTQLLNNPLFILSPLTEVFNKNNHEAIWQLQPVVGYPNTMDGIAFIYNPNYPDRTPVALSEGLIKAFEPGDIRKNLWVNTVKIEDDIYSFPYKYKYGSDISVPSIEYSTVLRLAEQYLIRAEARIQQNEIADGIDDLNRIRIRATDLTDAIIDQLKPLAGNLSKGDALIAVEHERRVELFSEWGHRWFDLKRTSRIDEVMSKVAPLKVVNGNWKSNQQWYPIYYVELQQAPNLVQNEGY